MISFIEASIQQLSVHKVGNKSQDGGCYLSQQPVALQDEILPGILLQYFLTPLQKTNEVYRFHHHSDDLELNGAFHFCRQLFEQEESFHDISRQLARHLYEVSDHPNIKTGEVYIVHFENVQIEGELAQAVGIFKSENKETYLKVSAANEGFDMGYEQEAINIKKLDKGCLVLNIEKEAGYKVVITDQTNRSGESVYWVDDFLKVKVRNDQFNQTSNVLSVYKNFVTQQMEEEFGISKPEKIDLLNRSITYFKQNENFNLDEFGEAVIGNPQGIESFRNYKKTYEEEYQTQIGDSFQISGAAVKKQARHFKSVLKLDKNFHIYIHGSNEWIEKGFDASVGKQFYKIYFNEES